MLAAYCAGQQKGPQVQKTVFTQSNFRTLGLHHAHGIKMVKASPPPPPSSSPT